MDPVGIGECDAYVNKFEACLKKLPEEERQAREAEAESQRKVLREEARHSELRALLEESCSAALAALKECP